MLARRHHLRVPSNTPRPPPLPPKPKPIAYTIKLRVHTPISPQILSYQIPCHPLCQIKIIDITGDLTAKSMTIEKEAQLLYQKVEHHEDSIRTLISTVREQTDLLENQQNIMQDKTSCERSMAMEWSKEKAHATQMEI